MFECYQNCEDLITSACNLVPAPALKTNLNVLNLLLLCVDIKEKCTYGKRVFPVKHNIVKVIPLHCLKIF